jgi:hypothetical protein
MSVGSLRWFLLGHELGNCISVAGSWRLLGCGDLLPIGLSVVAVCSSSVCSALCAPQEARGTNTPLHTDVVVCAERAV